MVVILQFVLCWTAGICDSGIVNWELAFLAGGGSQSEESESITIGLSGVV